MLWRSAIITTALCVCSLSAHAEPRRVVLADQSPALAEGIRGALEPWNIEVQVAGDATPPGASMPQNAVAARAIATLNDAQAVVWVAGSGVDYAVWVYDAKVDQVVSRALPSPPPFDEPTAAGVGLTVKVLLRHAEVAPPEERFGAVAADAPRPRRVAPPHVWFLASGGVRARPTEASDLEPRLGLGVAVFSTAVDPFGLQFLVRTGPGVSINDPAFVGHFSDLAISGAIVARLRVFGRTTLAPSAGVAAHFTQVDGIVTTSQFTPDVSRVNLHLEAGALISWAVGDQLQIGLRIDGAYAARRQTYVVGGEPVLDLPSTEAEGSLMLTLPFF